MIIKCLNCFKKFNVNSELIPDTGRKIICGSCKYSWDFKFDNSSQIKEIDEDTKEVIKINQTKKTFKYSNQFKKIDNSRINNFTIYLIVFLISFTALFILVDTFKSPLISVFPNLEVVLFNLFETLKDIKLFIIDLI